MLGNLRIAPPVFLRQVLKTAKNNIENNLVFRYFFGYTT